MFVPEEIYFICGFTQPKVTLERRIWALIYLLYKLFYFITGYFISSFYCSCKFALLGRYYSVHNILQFAE